MSKYLEILNNESFLMSEIKIIISNTLYYHSNTSSYNTFVTTFNFIDIDYRIFTINVLFDSRSINQIVNMIVKKYNLTISNSIQNIEYEYKAFNRKELDRIHFISVTDLL